MIHNKTFYKRNALSSAMCDLIIQEAGWQNQIDARVKQDDGDILRADLRKTSIVFEEHDSVIGSVIGNHILAANMIADWNFSLSFMQKVQLGKYEDGGYYDWHVDSYAPDENNMQRKLTCVVFLSDLKGYEGGLLEIVGAEPHVQEKGSLIVFPAFLQHRVTPVTKGVRYTATGWSMGPAFR